MVANALRIDLADPGIRFLGTPRLSNYQANLRETAGMTVPRFLQIHRLQAAINAGLFWPPEYYPPEGTPMNVLGLAISQGLLVSPADDPEYAATVLIDASNHAQLVHTHWPVMDTSGVWMAVAGNYSVLVGGTNVGWEYRSNGVHVHGVNPRTAVGLSRDQRHLFLLTIDGRQPGYSDGAWDYETGAWLQLLGAHDGINLDGGGSTLMVMEDSLGNPLPLSRSGALLDSGQERTVGSHLGIYASPLQGFINDVTALADDTAATITWTTLEPATTQVEYGLTANFGQTGPDQMANVTRHASRLTGLQPDTGYHFRCVSVSGGVRHVTSERFFRTLHYGVTNEVVALTSLWRFTTTPFDDPEWASPDYDDSRWSDPSAGLLWVDARPAELEPAIPSRGAVLPFDPTSEFPFTTYYFRTHFHLPATTAGVALYFSGYVDDGAVVYLNGREIHRLRMEEAPTPIHNSSLATSFPCDGDPTCLDEFTIPGNRIDPLIAGDNVLAVEVHNYNLLSPDVTFGLTLATIEPASVPALLAITNRERQTTLSWTRGGFVLQQADSLKGNWTDVEGPVVSSPYVATESNSTRYYRLRK